MELFTKITEELFLIPIEDRCYIIYAPLQKAAFIGNTALVNKIMALRNADITNISNQRPLKNFLEFLKIIKIGNDKLPITRFFGEPKPTSITLFLTNSCNLHCKYCYADAGVKPLQMMNLNTAKRGINFVIKNAIEQKKNIILNYHGGGEPTTNWSVMKDSLLYANKVACNYKLKVISALATNGVLNDEQIYWIMKYISNVSISFDGIPEVHDKYRQTSDGKGSSKWVINTLKKFDSVGYKYGIRITVTQDNIEKLPESIKYIYDNFNPTKILAEPVYQINRWRNAPSAETQGFVDSFRKAKAEAHKYNKELLFSAARIDILTNHYCGLSQDSFNLIPNGSISACYEAYDDTDELSKKFFYGKPDNNNGYIFDLNILAKLRNRTVDNIDFCKDCFAKWHCAGDCYYKALIYSGNEIFKGSDRCHITQELIKDQILEKIYHSGGMYWYDNSN
jgi:uncharacterized protein